MVSLAHALLASASSSASSSSSHAHSSSSSAASVGAGALVPLTTPTPRSDPLQLRRGIKRKGKEPLSSPETKAARQFETLLPAVIWNFIYGYLERYHPPSHTDPRLTWPRCPGEPGEPLQTLPVEDPPEEDWQLELDNQGLLEAVFRDPGLVEGDRRTLGSYNQKMIQSYFDRSQQVLRTLREKCERLSPLLEDPQAKEWHLKTAQDCKQVSLLLANFQEETPKKIHTFQTSTTPPETVQFTLFSLKESDPTQPQIQAILESILEALFDVEEGDANSLLEQRLFPKALSRILSGKELAYLFRAYEESCMDFIYYVSALLRTPMGKKHLTELCNDKEFRILFQPILYEAFQEEKWALVEWMSRNSYPEIRAAFLQNAAYFTDLLLKGASFESIERVLECLRWAIQKEDPNDALILRKMAALLFKYCSTTAFHPFTIVVGAYDWTVETSDGETTESVELFHFLRETCEWETSFSPREILECFTHNESAFVEQAVATGTIELLEYLFSSDAEPNLSTVLKRQQALYPEERLVTTAEGRKTTSKQTFEDIRLLFPPPYFDDCLRTKTPLEWTHALDSLIPPDLALIAASCNRTEVLDWIAEHPNPKIRATLEYVDEAGASLAEVALLEQALHDFMQSEIEARQRRVLIDPAEIMGGLEHSHFEISSRQDRVIPWMKARNMAHSRVGDLDLDSGAVYKLYFPRDEGYGLYHALKRWYKQGWIGQSNRLSARADLIKVFRKYRKKAMAPISPRVFQDGPRAKTPPPADTESPSLGTALSLGTGGGVLLQDNPLERILSLGNPSDE
jgi:hypothetical protein